MKPEWQWMKRFKRKRTTEENYAIRDKIVAARNKLAEEKANRVIEDLTGEKNDN